MVLTMETSFRSLLERTADVRSARTMAVFRIDCPELPPNAKPLAISIRSLPIALAAVLSQ